jgi:hypothetical protein
MIQNDWKSAALTNPEKRSAGFAFALAYNALCSSRTFGGVVRLTPIPPALATFCAALALRPLRSTIVTPFTAPTGLSAFNFHSGLRAR